MPMSSEHGRSRSGEDRADSAAPVAAPMAGKQTRSQQTAPQQAGGPRAGQPVADATTRAATQKLAPWVMDDDSMSAMGLSAPGSEEGEAAQEGVEAEASRAGSAGSEGKAEAPRAGAAGSEGMWRQVIGERSTAVGKLGRVRAPKGVRLRKTAAAGAADLGVLPFDELVSIERRTEHGWCWVIATGALSGSAGFCEEQFLAMDPPEPSAHLYRVAPGDELREIAQRAYGKSFHGGRDARLYVQALYEANKEHKGLYLTHVDLSRREKAERLEDDEHTLEIYKGAKVREGHAIWLPSEAFIEQLRASGTISDGTSAQSKLFHGLKNGASQAVDGAKYSAAFVVGILEGAWSAIADLFHGAADMVEAVAKIFYDVVTGNLGAIKDMLMGWVEKLKAAWGQRGEMAADFMAKWESEDAWTRGNFQGEVLGWVMMTALLIIATAGEAAAAMATGKWATVLRVLRAADALGDVTTYVGKAARLPGKAVTTLRRRFGKGAEAAAEGVESAAVKEGQHLAGETADAGRKAEAPMSHGGGEQHAGVGGGKFGVEQDSGLDMLTDPHPPQEVLDIRSSLKSAGEFSLQHDAKDAFRKLVRGFLARRAQEVDSALGHLRQAVGTGLERTSRRDLEEVFDYLFHSHGIQLEYANYAAWRRLSTGAAMVDDLRFIHHELEEIKSLRLGGLENPLGEGLSGEGLQAWRQSFLSKHYLPAHQKALDTELEFLSQEIQKRTGGEVRLSAEEIAMSDQVRTEAKAYALRDGHPIEDHPLATAWDRSTEIVTLSSDVAARLHLPLSTRIERVIQAVKTSLVRSVQ
jgi:hypothetical protein